MPAQSDRSATPAFNFLPVSIRLETLGGLATPLVLRGTPLPTERVEMWSTADDNQTAIEISILMGERPLASKSIRIGKFMLSGITPAPAGKAEVRVAIRIGRDCAMTAHATVEGSPLSAVQELRPDPKYLREAVIAKIRADAAAHREEDQKLVSYVEARNRANRLIRQGEARLASERGRKSSLLDLDAVARAIAQVGQALESEEVDQIRAESAALESSLRQPELDLSAFLGGSPFEGIFGSGATSRSVRPAPRRRPVPAEEARRPDSESLHSPALPATASRSARLGKVFGGGEYTLDPNLCFTLMPFDDTFAPIYEDHIKPTVLAAGLTCQRADDIRGVNVITADIWEQINRARFLVADLTHRNANVFYEVGLAHAIGKDVLLITQTIDDVPFDLRAIRCLVYSYTPHGMKEFASTFRATIDAIVKSPPGQ